MGFGEFDMRDYWPRKTSHGTCNHCNGFALISSDPTMWFCGRCKITFRHGKPWDKPIPKTPEEIYWEKYYGSFVRVA